MIFSRSKLLVRVCFLLSISFISALIFVISFLLLALGCFLFFSFPKLKARLLILDHFKCRHLQLTNFPLSTVFTASHVSILFFIHLKVFLKILVISSLTNWWYKGVLYLVYFTEVREDNWYGFSL